MKIALLGYGKMGKKVHEHAQNQKDTIEVIIDPKDGVPLSLEALHGVDVCIDFTTSTAVLENAKIVAKAKKNLVIGTTGFDSELPSLKALVKEHAIGCLFAPNFSIGVALFRKIVANASALFNRFPEYDRSGIEMHHRQKKDAPSGTALSLQKAAELKTPFLSVRCGSIPGTHTLIFDGECDTITLSHTARSRDGFAKGALLAAHWLQGKQGFFSLEDIL